MSCPSAFASREIDGMRCWLDCFVGIVGIAALECCVASIRLFQARGVASILIISRMVIIVACVNCRCNVCSLCLRCRICICGVMQNSFEHSKVELCRGWNLGRNRWVMRMSPMTQLHMKLLVLIAVPCDLCWIARTYHWVDWILNWTLGIIHRGCNA